MKVYSRAKLKKLFIVSTVIGLAIVIAMMAFGGLSYFGDNVGVAIIVLFFGFIFMPLEIMAFVFNWKKILVGYIAPIPILSSIIESFKGLVWAIKAFIALLKKEEQFVIGKKDEE